MSAAELVFELGELSGSIGELPTHVAAEWVAWAQDILRRSALALSGEPEAQRPNCDLGELH
jgi:hypothetical protein